MITIFKIFEKNDWLNKYDLPSDNIRYYYLYNEVHSNIKNDIVKINKLTDTWDGYDDLLFVKNRGTYIDYYEGFVDSCWDAIYSKPEYVGLNKKEAVDKLVNDRIIKISNDLNIKILYYTFKKSILYIKFQIKKGDY
jgi:hypothetical protein